MPNIIEITDFHAPELDPYARLTQNQLRNRLEPEKGIFIAESPKVIDRALDAGYKPVSLLMERKQITGPAAGILSRCGDAPVYTADREMLAELTGFELTRGVLCAFHRPAPRPVEELCKNARRVAVLEGIVDSTNVGAIFRSAAALNMDAVLINPSCCDPLCRRAVRVSMGTVFQVPWGQLGETPADWPEKGMDILHSLGFKTAAMALSDRSVSIDDEQLAKEPKLAIVFGTEGTWSPWTYHDENDQLVGFDIEVAQKVAEKLGVKATFVEGEWDGLLAGVDGGRYDSMANGVEITEERAQKYDFSDPYCYIRTAIIVKSDDDSINSFEDLNGKATANTISSTYATLAESYGAKTTGVDDLNQTIELLLNGRVDATLNAEVTYFDYLKEHPDANIKIAALTNDASQVAFPVRKGDETATMREALNQAINELREDGTIAEISEKYFGTDLSQAPSAN